jgi:hypothetical protein
MSTVQGSLTLLNDPVAQELLRSKIPARFAYVWQLNVALAVHADAQSLGRLQWSRRQCAIRTLLVSLHFRFNRSTSSAANLESSPGAPPELFRKAVVYRLTERLYAASKSAHLWQYILCVSISPPAPAQLNLRKATGDEGENPDRL